MLTRPGMDFLSQAGRSKGRLVGADGRGWSASAALLVSSSSLAAVGPGRKGLGKREERCSCGGYQTQKKHGGGSGLSGPFYVTLTHANAARTLRASSRAVALPPYAPSGTDGAVASPHRFLPRSSRMKPFSPQPRPQLFFAIQNSWPVSSDLP